jgi:hypothetical protein
VNWTQERALKLTTELRISLLPEIFSSVRIQAIISSGFAELVNQSQDNKQYTEHAV